MVNRFCLPYKLLAVHDSEKLQVYLFYNEAESTLKDAAVDRLAVSALVRTQGS